VFVKREHIEGGTMFELWEVRLHVRSNRSVGDVRGVPRAAAQTGPSRRL
jgi:hypothetical protein